MLIGSETPMSYKDVLVITSLAASIGLETLADEQQWVYQKAKRAVPSKSTRSHSRGGSHVSYCQPEDIQRGFITGGLFRYSRHPNFACEQANWYLFYAFGCIATVRFHYIFANMNAEDVMELDCNCSTCAYDSYIYGTNSSSKNR
jgi:steroid 5-alpha reductase family enzyme